MADASDKDPGAMLTIGELSAELGLATHILRYWETKFSQLKPLKRSGNRRYYRSEDVALTRRIDDLLNKRGFTIKGAQKELRNPPAGSDRQSVATGTMPSIAFENLRSVRAKLAEALAAA